MTTASPRRLLLILVDGLGFADIQQARAPFLASEMAAGLVRPLRPVLGYSDAQRAVLLTGKLPDQIGYWMLYRFASAHESPWRWLSWLSPLDRVGSMLPTRMFKIGLSQTALRAQSRISGRGDLALHNIPFRALKWMRPAHEPPVYAGLPVAGTPTLLSIASQQNLPWRVLRSDSFAALVRQQSVEAWLPSAIKQINAMSADTRLVFMYIHHPDLLSHRYGWQHERTGAEVRRVDEALKTLVAAVTARLGPDLETVIVSDHGMDDTKTFLDFSDLVTHPDFGKKFVVALDSTMVRAIYLDSSGARTVRDRLSTVSGRFLTKEDRTRFGIDFPGEWYGEDIFLLKEGASIYPNFHSLLRPLSMHAYDPALESQTAFAYAAGATAERAIAEAAAQNPLAMNHLFPVFARIIGA